MRNGRLAKAEQFASAAELIDELADGDQDLCDAYVTLCVHAGIAAADVLCCAKLGRHATGENHDEAKRLVSLVDPGAGQALGTLLGMKTKAGYSALRMTATDRRRASRAAEALLTGARLSSTA